MNEQYEYCIQVKRHCSELWVVERKPYQTLGKAKAAIKTSWILQLAAKRNNLRIMRRKVGEWEQVKQ